MGPRERSPSTVHLWWMNLDTIAKGRGSELGRWLSDDERQRAERSSSEDLRRRFTAGREALRALLGAYRSIGPADVTFEYGPQGKPSLVGGRVRFSVAHTDTLCSIVVSEREVGVDVERIRDDFDMERVVAQMFTDEDAVVVNDAPPEERTRAFFERWVTIEARAKADGRGVYPAIAPSRNAASGAGPFASSPFSFGPDVVGCVVASGTEEITLSIHQLTSLDDLSRLVPIALGSRPLTA